MIPLLIVSVIILTDFIKEMKMPKWIIVAGAYAFFTVYVLMMYRTTLNYGEQLTDVKKLVEYYNNTDYDIIYIYGEMDVSEELRVWGNPRHYICVSSKGICGVCDFYDYYNDAQMLYDNTALIVKNCTYDFGENSEFNGHKVFEEGEIGAYKIYNFGD